MSSMSSNNKSIELKSRFGNEVKFRFTKLEDGNYEFVVNGEGYVLSPDEAKKVKKHIESAE